MELYNEHFFSSSYLKRNIIEKNSVMMVLTFLDMIFSFIYGIYYTLNFYNLPLILSGMIGTWTYRPKLIYIYQIYNAINICLRCYTIIDYGELYLWSLMPIQFYFIYKHWFYIFEINQLNEDELNIVRKGWNSY